jgi:cobalt-zinc-cadmium efflux system outer membrane protein
LDEGDNIVGGGVNIPIPTFNWNQGNIEKSLARQDVLEYQLFKSRTQISKEVLTAAANFNLAVAEVGIFTKEILPRLNETLELVKEAFRLGQIDQLTVTISQNEFIQTRFSYLEALSEYYNTLVELEKAAAEDINKLSLLN